MINYFITHLGTLSKKKSFIYLISFLIVFISTSLFYLSLSNKSLKKQKIITIHYIARYSNESNSDKLRKSIYSFAKLNEVSLRKYLSDIENDRPEISFNLISHDNKSDKLESVRIYNEIIENATNNPFFVVDNTWGVHIQECANLIKSHNIPVIAINADHGNLNYGKSVIFIANSDNTPSISAKFISKILKLQNIIFISETNYNLHEIYEDKFEDNGISIVGEIELKYSNKGISPVDSIKFIKKIDSLVKKFPNTLLFLNVHSEWGNYILKIVNEKYNNIKVTSPIYSTPYLSKELNPKNNNEFITITSGEDIISKKIKDEIDYFRSSKFEKYFRRKTSHEFIQRCKIATDILNNCIGSKNVYKRFNEYTENISKFPIISKDELYQFDDDNGNIELKREFTFSSFKNGVLKSYPLQISNSGIPIPNLYFGMEIESIYDIDLETGNYTIDYYYWLKIDTSFQHLEKLINFSDLNILRKHQMIDKIIEGTGSKYILYKVSANCNQKFDLSNYPIDIHWLKLNAEFLEPNANVRMSFDHSIINNSKENLELINVENWKPTEQFTTVDNIIAKSSKGITYSDISTKYKSISFWVKIQRKSLIPIIGLLLPIVLIGFIGIGLLFLKEQAFSKFSDITSGLLVSTLLISISLIELTPSTGVLKKTDLIYWETLLIILIDFILLVFFNSIYMKTKQPNTNIRKFIGYFLVFLYPITIIIILTT